MRFVKPVPGELFHQVKDFYRQLAVDAVLSGALFKDGTLFRHLFRLFLTHRTTQHIRAAKGVTGKHLGNLHNLFLVQDDAVGRLQYGFQAFMLPLHVWIGNLFTAMLTVDEVIHHARLQRAGAEQRHQRDHIFEAVRLQTLNQIFHATGFKLEDRRGFRALQHVETFLVIQRDRRDIQRRFAILLTAGVDHLQRPVNDGERAQPQEVEFDQPGVFHVVFIKLRYRVLTGLITVQRRKIGDFGRRDNHATSVLTGVTRDAFQLARHIDQRFNFLIRLVNFRQLRFRLKRFRQRHAWVRRHQLRDTIHETIWVPQHAPHVADNRFRRHRTEGNNLRYRIAAVHVRDVFDNLVAFLHTEVNVEVRHGDTFRVKETFEQQVEFQRIKVGNFQRIGHQRPRTGTAPRPYRYAVIFRPLDKLHHDEEVAREPHLVNNLKFNVQTFVIGGTLLFTHRFVREQEFETFFQTLFRFLDQEVFGGHVARRKLRQEVFAQTDGHVTAFGYLNAVFQRFRDVGEQLAHLVFATHILLRRVVTRAFRIVERKTIVNSHADFVRVKVLAVNKADIIRCDNRQATRFRQFNRRMQIRFLILPTRADQLQIVAVGEMFFIEGDAFVHQRTVAAQQTAAHIAHPATGKQNQTVF